MLMQLIIAIALAMLSEASSGIYAANELQHLQQDIMAGGRLTVIPTPASEDPLVVQFGAELQRLVDVDEDNGLITTNFWITMFWKNPAIAWNPDNYGGIKTINIPYEDIWTPDISMWTDVGVQSGETSVARSSDLAVVTNEGNIMMVISENYRSPCDLRKKGKAPVECELIFGSWTYGGNQMTVKDDKDSPVWNKPDEKKCIHPHWKLDGELVKRQEKHYYDATTEAYYDITYTMRLVPIE